MDLYIILKLFKSVFSRSIIWGSFSLFYWLSLYLIRPLQFAAYDIYVFSISSAILGVVSPYVFHFFPLSMSRIMLLQIIFSVMRGICVAAIVVPIFSISSYFTVLYLGVVDRWGYYSFTYGPVLMGHLSVFLIFYSLVDHFLLFAISNISSPKPFAKPVQVQKFDDAK